MKSKTTSDRLKQIMAERHLRQIDILNMAKPFCDKFGIKLGKNDLSQYVNGKVEPRQEKLTVLGHALGVSEAWLMGYDVPQDRTQDKVSETDSPDLPPNAIPYKPTKMIPILGRISAGMPLFAEENIEGWMATDLNHGGEYFALRVVGDSMDAAGIKENYIVTVRRQDCVENGEIAAVIVGDDEATLKRFYQSGNTVTLMPQSTNAAHVPQIYDLAETRVLVLGKVVEVKFSPK